MKVEHFKKNEIKVTAQNQQDLIMNYRLYVQAYGRVKVKGFDINAYEVVILPARLGVQVDEYMFKSRHV